MPQPRCDFLNGGTSCAEPSSEPPRSEGVQRGRGGDRRLPCSRSSAEDNLAFKISPISKNRRNVIYLRHESLNSSGHLRHLGNEKSYVQTGQTLHPHGLGLG